MILIAAALVLQPVPRFGGYAPDFSHASAKYRDTLRAIFPGTLHLSRDGTFIFVASQREGFWRVHGRDLILVFRSFFNLPLVEPEEVLRRRWPTDAVEGHVLKILADGTLVLPAVAQMKGPIYWRRKPRLSTLAWVKREDTASSEDIEPFVVLQDEASDRWRDLIGIVRDHTLGYRLRFSASIFLRPTIGPEGGEKILRTLASLDDNGLTQRQLRSLQRGLARSVSRFASHKLTAELLQIALKLDTPPYILADAIGASRFREGVPALEAWTTSKTPSDRSASARALGTLGDKGALPYLRALQIDPDRRVLQAARVAIAKLSDDIVESDHAVDTLASQLGSKEPYADAVTVDALGETGSRRAVPYLVTVLETSPDSFLRRSAAEQLGNLGFPEAVPALLNAKRPSPDVLHPDLMKRKFEESFPPSGKLTKDKVQTVLSSFQAELDQAVNTGPVSVAAAEALYKIEHRVKGGTGSK